MNMQIREEQLVYAKWLNVGMVFGFIVLVISFINYVFSFFLDAHIELDKILNIGHFQLMNFGSPQTLQVDGIG